MRKKLEMGVGQFLNGAFGTSRNLGFQQGFRMAAQNENSIASALRNRALADQTNQFMSQRNQGLKFLDERGANDPVFANQAAGVRVSGENVNPNTFSLGLKNLQDFDTNRQAIQEVGGATGGTPNRQTFEDMRTHGLDPNSPEDAEVIRQMRVENSRAGSGLKSPNPALDATGRSRSVGSHLKASFLNQLAGGKPLVQFQDGKFGAFDPLTGQQADPRLLDANVGAKQAGSVADLALAGQRGAAGDKLRAETVEIPKTEAARRGKFVAEAGAADALAGKRDNEAMSVSEKLRRDNSQSDAELKKIDAETEKVLASIKKIEAETERVNTGVALTETGRRSSQAAILKTLIEQRVRDSNGDLVKDLPPEEQALIVLQVEKRLNMTPEQADSIPVMGRKRPEKKQQVDVLEKIQKFLFGQDQPEAPAPAQREVAIPPQANVVPRGTSEPRSPQIIPRQATDQDVAGAIQGSVQVGDEIVTASDGQVYNLSAMERHLAQVPRENFAEAVRNAMGQLPEDLRGVLRDRALNISRGGG